VLRCINGAKSDIYIPFVQGVNPDAEENIHFGENLEHYVTIFQYQQQDTITRQQYYDTFWWTIMRDNQVNQGWKQTDEWYLHRFDNPSNDPEIQVITEDNWEDENKELREYFCTICKSRLDYLKSMDMWYCEACVEYYLLLLFCDCNTLYA
jgi:hypothetical protein